MHFPDSKNGFLEFSLPRFAKRKIEIVENGEQRFESLGERAEQVGSTLGAQHTMNQEYASVHAQCG